MTAHFRPAALLPYLVLLPVGFAEPGRSPGLLVSSYLTVSPLPRPVAKRAESRAVCSLWHCPYRSHFSVNFDGGGSPAPRPLGSRLPSAARPSPAAFSARLLGRPRNPHPAATATFAPATNSNCMIKGYPRPPQAALNWRELPSLLRRLRTNM